MGLSTTHDCYRGSYGGFMSWRRAICAAAGWGNISDYQWFGGEKPWPDGDVLVELLRHSDCDGSLASHICAPLADRLEALIPAITGPTAFIDVDTTRQFIEGLRAAAEAGEDVEFH